MVLDVITTVHNLAYLLLVAVARRCFCHLIDFSVF